MKIVFVSVSMAELKTTMNAVAEPFAKAVVEKLFEPMITKGSCKKVKK